MFAALFQGKKKREKIGQGNIEVGEEATQQYPLGKSVYLCKIFVWQLREFFV